MSESNVVQIGTPRQPWEDFQEREALRAKEMKRARDRERRQRHKLHKARARELVFVRKAFEAAVEAAFDDVIVERMLRVAQASLESSRDYGVDLPKEDAIRVMAAGISERATAMLARVLRDRIERL